MFLIRRIRAILTKWIKVFWSYNNGYDSGKTKIDGVRISLSENFGNGDSTEISCGSISV